MLFREASADRRHPLRMGTLKPDAHAHGLKSNLLPHG